MKAPTNSPASTALAQALGRSIRPQATILPWLLFSSIVTAAHGFDLYVIFLGLILLISVYGIVTIHNDLSDQKIDRANKRSDIPLANGDVKQHQLEYFIVALTLIAIISSGLISPLALLWTSVYILLGWLYSGPLSFKSKGFLALLVLASCYGVMPIILGWIAIGILPGISSLLIALAVFIFVFGIISLKDFKDLKGDKEQHKRTVLVQYGTKFTRLFMLFVTSLGYIILLPLWLQYPIGLAACCVLLAINFHLLSQKSILSSGNSRKKYGSLARMLFFINVIMLQFFVYP